MQRRCCWPPDRLSAERFSRSLTSSQRAAAAQRAFHAPVEVVLEAEDAQPVGDVVVDRLRKRVRPLEDHADPAANLDRVDAGPVQVDAVVEQRALDLRARNQIVHPVEAAEHGRLSAAGRPDQRRDRVAADVECHVLDRGHLAVVHRELVDREDDLVFERPAAEGGVTRPIACERWSSGASIVFTSGVFRRPQHVGVHRM